MSAIFWQWQRAQVGEVFETPSGTWTVLESRLAHDGGFLVIAEQRS